MIKQKELSFGINGEFLTNVVREWFYLEGKGYDKCIELLKQCMKGTDETEAEIRRHAEDILLGRAGLAGNTRDGSYHLEIYAPEDEEMLLDSMNIWKTAEKVKRLEDELRQYKTIWNAVKEQVPLDMLYQIKEVLGDDIEEKIMNLGHEEGTVGSFLKRMEHIDEHTTEDYGWLEPNGTFHEVEFGEHQSWADKYLEEHATEEEKSDYSIFPGDYLTEKGWVLLHNPSQGIAMVTKDAFKQYTKAQKEFLFDYYMQRNCQKEANDIWKEE